MLKAPIEKRTFNVNVQKIVDMSVNGANGELNPQVLQLMKSLNIDISKTKTVSTIYIIYIQYIQYRVSHIKL